MPLGRPTKYEGDATVLRTREYFFDSVLTAGDNIPSIEGLAVYLDVNKSTIYEWKDKNVDFSNAIKNGEAHQARALINLMTDKERFTAGSIFVAKNILGWSDKKDIVVDHNITAFEVLADED
jgi:hypothetical protein